MGENTDPKVKHPKNAEDEEEEIKLDFLTNMFKKKTDNQIDEAQQEAQDLKGHIDEEIKKEEEKLEELKEKEKEVEDITNDLNKKEKQVEQVAAKEAIIIKEVKEDKKKLEEIEEKDEDEDISFDFSKVKGMFKQKGDVKGGATSETNSSSKKTSSDTLSLKDSALAIGSFFKKYGVIFLVLIPLLLSVFFRAYPVYLPITDDWAQNSVHSGIQNQIRNQINQQYPNLPDANKNVLIQEQFNEVLNQQGSAIDQQIQLTSDQFKSRLQDDGGNTYLLAIDPWLWYGQIRASLESGFFGNEIVDEQEWYDVRNGRFGKTAEKTFTVNLHAGRIVYGFMSFFNKNVSLMQAFFLVPLIIVSLSTIPAFFIARRFAGNTAGFFAGCIVALNAALLGRTPAGFADTDPYNVFFPLFIAWMFIEAMYAKTPKMRLIYASLAGLLVGIFAKAWSGFWYPLMFVLATLLISIGFYAGTWLLRNKDKEWVRNIKTDISILVTFLVSSLLFVLILRGSKAVMGVISGPFKFMTLKEVAVTSYWPNVLTTVAEFNEVPLTNIIGQMGGTVLFWIAFVGITLLLTNIKDKKDLIFIGASALYYAVVLANAATLNKPLIFMFWLSLPIVAGIIKIFWYKEHGINVAYALFLTLWLFSTMYAFTKGTRFAILMVPAVAIGIGVALGRTQKHTAGLIHRTIDMPKVITSVVIVLIFLLLLVNPLKAAHSIGKSEVPSMNDAWYQTLTEIKEDSDDAIITSWWDFGHWFAAVAERKVTFDGADQGRRIHYVGKSLLVSDEKESAAILKALNCGQQKGPNLMEKYFEGDTAKSMDLLNTIILQDKETAIETMRGAGLTEDQIENMTTLTHCEDIIPQYFITSQDMIGKAGVWGHFGSWDFHRAKMHNLVSGTTLVEGLEILEDEFNITGEEAENMYFDIQANKADGWVSPWPPYMGGPLNARVDGEVVTCDNGIQINTTNNEVYIPSQNGFVQPPSYVYTTEEGIITKEFENGTFQASVALIPRGRSGYQCLLAHPLLIDSTFTKLYYFDGHGMKHFKKFSDRTSFTNLRIVTWKVDFEGAEPHVIDKYVKTVLDGDSVRVDYIGWTEEGIFDSSILGWQGKTVTPETSLNRDDTRSLQVQVGRGGVIQGFNDALLGMKEGEEKTVEIPPERGYGTDPSAHPLGNKTLSFKVRVVDIS